jgi:hypothetical protein
LSRADEAAKARLFAQEYNRTTVQTSLFSTCTDISRCVPLMHNWR